MWSWPSLVVYGSHLLLLEVVTHYILSCFWVSEGCVFPKSRQTFPQWREPSVILQTQQLAWLFSAAHKVLQTCVSHSCNQSDSQGSTCESLKKSYRHVGVVQLGVTRLSSVQPTSAQTVQPSSTWCKPVQLGVTQFYSVWHVSTWSDSIQLGATQFNLVRLRSTRCDSDQLGATRFNSVQLNSVWLTFNNWRLTCRWASTGLIRQRLLN